MGAQLPRLTHRLPQDVSPEEWAQAARKIVFDDWESNVAPDGMDCPCLGYGASQGGTDEE